MNSSSDQVSALILPSVLGLIAGMFYGLASHYADLPMALTEHFVPASAAYRSQH